jgi:hypothetical protein
VVGTAWSTARILIDRQYNTREIASRREKGGSLSRPFFIVCAELVLQRQRCAAPRRLLPNQPHKPVFCFGVGFKFARHGAGDAGDVGFVDAAR